MSIEGSIGDFGPPEIFQLLVRQQREGELTFVLEGNRTISVQFKKGQIILSDDGHSEEALGNALIRAGKITVDQLNRVFREQGNRSLALTLSMLGYVSSGEIKKIHTQITEEAVFGLFKIEKGHYKFTPMEIFYDSNFIEPLTLSGEFVIKEKPKEEGIEVPLPPENILPDLIVDKHIAQIRRQDDPQVVPHQIPPHISLTPDHLTARQLILKGFLNGITIGICLMAFFFSYPVMRTVFLGANASLRETLSLKVWREKELIRRALDLYYLKYHHYPESLSALVDNHFLALDQEAGLSMWRYSSSSNAYHLDGL